MTERREVRVAGKGEETLPSNQEEREVLTEGEIPAGSQARRRRRRAADRHRATGRRWR